MCFLNTHTVIWSCASRVPQVHSSRQMHASTPARRTSAPLVRIGGRCNAVHTLLQIGAQQCTLKGNSRARFVLHKTLFKIKNPHTPFSCVLSTANAVGGFAGGELGLQQFVTEGDVKIAEDGMQQRVFCTMLCNKKLASAFLYILTVTSTGSARRQGPSTLLIAGVVAVAGTVGGLTLTQATNFSQELAASGSGSALDVLDDNTKLLLQAAIVLIGITAGLAGTRAAFKAMTDSVTENALNLVCGFFDKGVVKPYGRHTNLPTPQAKVTVFWIVVFLAARFVLQS